MRSSWLITVVVASVVWSAPARADQPEPVVIAGLRPATGSMNGPTNIRKLGEAQRLRRVLGGVVRELAQRPIIDDTGLRSALGVEYLVDVMDCRSAVPCVVKRLAKLRKVSSIAVYGDYTSADRKYRFRIRVLDLRKSALLGAVELELAEPDIEDRKLWSRELESLIEESVKAAPAEPPGGTPPEPPNAVPPPKVETPPPSGTPTGESPEAPPPAPDPPSEAGATTTEPKPDEVPELAPISTADESEPIAAGAASAFIDNSVLDAISRGIIWHGHFQNYSAVGIRRAFRRDIVTFDDRLQLEFEHDINKVRVVGKPQLNFNLLDGGSFAFRFREMYAARDYKRSDISVGEQIITWGVTDFWPVVDIINPRDYSQFKNWQPIDEKIATPVVQVKMLLGPMTIHLIGVLAMGRSALQLDQTKPFAIPIPAPPGATIEQRDAPASLDNTGGGTRIDLTAGSWKFSVYGLVGRDPLPAVYAQIEPDTGATTLFVDNDRVLMGAASLVGTIPGVGAVLKMEGAYYHRLDDECRGMTADVGGLPQCFYLRRVPTGRANIGLERRIAPGLEAHVQFISELTRSEDVPRVPPALEMIAPGFPEQYTWNRIVTMRLQGNWLSGDFQPRAFAYWSYDDEAFFANAELDYRLADGLALAVGAFQFQGYAANPNKDRYTLAGSLASSSNVYLRATAWF